MPEFMSLEELQRADLVRRIEQAVGYLDRCEDKVEYSGKLAFITFGAHLTVYVEGDQFWIGEKPSMIGRRLPRLKAFARAHIFIQALHVTERVIEPFTIPAMSLVMPNVPRFRRPEDEPLIDRLRRAHNPNHVLLRDEEEFLTDFLLFWVSKEYSHFTLVFTVTQAKSEGVFLDLLSEALEALESALV